MSMLDTVKKFLAGEVTEEQLNVAVDAEVEAEQVAAVRAESDAYVLASEHSARFASLREQNTEREFKC